MSVEKVFKREDFPRYTIADWEQWEGQWELIEGIAWAMSPMPNSRHQEISGNLFALFKAALRPCKTCKVFLPLNYRVDEDTLLHPDLLIVCKPPYKFLYLESRPSVVLEVLSPSTAHKDLMIKAELYARQGIPYYVVVHPDEEWIRVMSLENKEWAIEMEGHVGEYEFHLDGCIAKVDFSTAWD